jgi:hypothetical protein
VFLGITNSGKNILLKNAKILILTALFSLSDDSSKNCSILTKFSEKIISLAKF